MGTLVLKRVKIQKMSKAKRMEAKKRKIEAFLNLAKLNDEEGRKRASLAKRFKPEDNLENCEKSPRENLRDESSEKVIESSPKKDKVHGESLDELRKMLRERKKKLQSIPNFNLKTKGYDASLEIPEDLRTSLLMRDLQSLLLYALMGTQAPVEPSRWCKFEQWNKLTHINCLAIEGMGIEDFSNMSSSMKSIFPFQLEFVSPFAYNSTLADDLSILPLSIGRKKQLANKYKSLEKACKEGQAFKVFRSLFNVKTSIETDK